MLVAAGDFTVSVLHDSIFWALSNTGRSVLLVSSRAGDELAVFSVQLLAGRARGSVAFFSLEGPSFRAGNSDALLAIGLVKGWA